MRKIVNDSELTEVFSKVGKIYGYDDVKASFSPFADFKVKWERTYRMANFSVSDFIINTREDVIECLAEGLFRRICNLSFDGFGDKFNEFVLNEDFCKKNRSSYIERHDLEREPFTMKNDVAVHWSNKPMYNCGYCSTLMKIIVLNNEIKEAPKKILDTIIDMEYNHIQDGLMNFNGDANHIDIPFKDVTEARSWLAKNNIKIGSGMFE